MRAINLHQRLFVPTDDFSYQFDFPKGRRDPNNHGWPVRIWIKLTGEFISYPHMYADRVYLATNRISVRVTDALSFERILRKMGFMQNIVLLYQHTP